MGCGASAQPSDDGTTAEAAHPDMAKAHAKIKLLESQLADKQASTAPATTTASPSKANKGN